MYQVGEAVTLLRTINGNVQAQVVEAERVNGSMFYRVRVGIEAIWVAEHRIAKR